MLKECCEVPRILRRLFLTWSSMWSNIWKNWVVHAYLVMLKDSCMLMQGDNCPLKMLQGCSNSCRGCVGSQPLEGCWMSAFRDRTDMVTEMNKPQFIHDPQSRISLNQCLIGKTNGLSTPMSRQSSIWSSCPIEGGEHLRNESATWQLQNIGAGEIWLRNSQCQYRRVSIATFQ